LLEGASHEVVASESMIQNHLDIVVVFPHRTPRVEIRGVRMLHGKNDESAVLVSAQNNSDRMLEKNDGNLRKHVNYGG
jgi:hypothetical protein